MLKKIFNDYSEEENFYENLLAYKEYVYINEFSNESREFFKEKYNILKETQKINGYKSLGEFNVSHNIIKNELDDKIKLYKEAYILNKEDIKNLGEQIEKIFLTYIPINIPIYDKILFIVYFVKKFFTYSENNLLHNYILSMNHGYDIDVKNGVPVDYSINGLFAISQGVCEDICDLINYLSQKMCIKSHKVFTRYNGNSHALNIFEISKGVYSLCDVTRIIRNDKRIDECILVSDIELNKNNEYYDDLYNKDFVFIKVNPKEFVSIDKNYYTNFEHKYGFLINLIEHSISNVKKDIFDQEYYTSKMKIK